MFNKNFVTLRKVIQGQNKNTYKNIRGTYIIQLFVHTIYNNDYEM